jgi:hypothetical protein
MIYKKLILGLIYFIVAGFFEQAIAQADTSTKVNYSFATSVSADGKTIYVSTIFCWMCDDKHPCNGVVFGKNTKSPCDFLEDWALTVFKAKVPKFDGVKATVPCLTESLTMYYYSDKKNIATKRQEVINNNKQLHKIVVAVVFPACKN